MQRSRTLASCNVPKRGRFMIKVLQPEEGWDIFWTSLRFHFLKTASDATEWRSLADWLIQSASKIFDFQYHTVPEFCF